MNTRYGPFLEDVSKIFSMGKLDIINSSNLIDTITVDRFLNRPVPSSLTPEIYQNLLHLNYYSHFLRYSKNVSRAVSTPKLSKILSVFDKRIS